MKQENDNSPETASLRQKAEEHELRTNSAKAVPRTEAETLKLMYELASQRMELKIQNEILRLARDKAEIAAEKFMALYDFAPMGCFTVNQGGIICGLNLTGAKLLGRERSELIDSNFRIFVSPETLPVFNDFFQRVFTSRIKETCELSFTIQGFPPVCIHLEGIVTEDGKDCLLAGLDITDRKNAEIQIKDSEINYKTLLENTGTFIVIIDVDGVYRLINARAVNLFGCKEEEEILGKTVFDFLPPDRAKKFLERNRKIIESGIDSEYEDTFCLSGRNITFLTINHVLKDKQGKGYALQSSSIDITERKIAEEKVRQSEIKYRELFQINKDGISIFQLSHEGRVGKFVEMNDAAPAILGYTKEELLRLTPMDLVTDLNKSQIRYIRKKLAQHDIVRSDIRLRHKDGHDVSVDCSAQLIEYDGKPAIMNVVRDITEQKLAEKALKESEENYRTLVNNADDSIFLTDLEGKYLFRNNACYISRGYEPGDESIPQRRCDFIHPEDIPLILDQWKVILEKGKASAEYRVRHKDGHWVYRLSKAIIIADENGNNKSVLSIARDTTQQKLAEQKIIESENRYRYLFEHAVVPILEMDFSEVKFFFDKLSGKHVKDFRTYFRKHPRMINHCFSLIKVIGMNQTCLSFFGASDKYRLMSELISLFTGHAFASFLEVLIELAAGAKESTGDVPIKLPGRDIQHLHFRLMVEPEHYTTLSKVLISWIDITDSKKYEEVLKQSSEDLRELAKHIEDIRENERAAISLNLHDDLGQKLTALKMNIAWIKNRMGVQSNTVEKKFSEMTLLIDDSVRTIQRISSELRPGILYNLGLTAAIEWQLADFGKTTGIRISSKILPEEVTVDEKLSLAIFRIIQESLTNISRHAAASKVSVDLISGHTELSLTIRDNGIGIDLEKVSNPKSFGLMSMKERIRANGGTMKIACLKEGGTIITATFPFARRLNHTAS